MAEQGRQTLHDGSRACWRGGTLIHPRQPVRPFDDGTTIVTARLSLVPLRVEGAEEMTGVLGDERLHEFIGGEPDTITGLRERYARLVAGSPDRDKLWLSWVIRRRSDAQPMGWLRRHGADNVVAHIHPNHQASAAVAMRAGLRLTDEQADGERVWRAPDSGA